MHLKASWVVVMYTMNNHTYNAMQFCHSRTYKALYPVAGLGFHEGGVRKVGRSCAAAKFFKPRPFPAKKKHAFLNNTPGVELGVCLRFILAACSLEVVYTGKIAITVDTKKNMTVSNGYNNTSSL